MRHKLINGAYRIDCVALTKLMTGIGLGLTSCDNLTLNGVYALVCCYGITFIYVTLLLDNQHIFSTTSET